MSLLRALPAGRSAPLAQAAIMHHSAKPLRAEQAAAGPGRRRGLSPRPVRSGTNAAFKKGKIRSSLLLTTFCTIAQENM